MIRLRRFFFASGLTLFTLLCLAEMAAAQTAAQTGAGSTSEMFASHFAHMREHLQQLALAVPSLPGYFQDVSASFRAAAGGTGVVLIVLGLVVCVAAGAAVEWLFRRATAGLRARRKAVEIRQVFDRLTKVGIDGMLEVGAIVAFALGTLVALLVQKWPHAVQESGIAFLVALIGVRFASALLRVLLHPNHGVDRDLAAFDLPPHVARFWHRHLVTFVGWFAFGWAAMATFSTFGMPRDGQQLLAYVMGIGLVVIALTMIWRREPTKPVAGRNVAGSAAGRALASIVAVAFWLAWAIGAMPTFWFLVAAVGLPIMVGVARRASRYLLRPVNVADGGLAVPSVLAVVVEQGLRAALIVGAIFLLLWAWGLDVGSLAAQESTVTRVARGALHALIILLLADLAWSVFKAIADSTLANAQVTAGIDADEARRRARIRTLLPIGRNVAFIVLLVMAGLMALAALGVEIGPLVASAGVVGVAVGFGAQTVVKDIISGMFYMLDDAFRVGEYIQSGSYKGVVESFSLRSVKLRHQRGPLFTIPFGILGAVQNMSRDWVIVKDVIGITYDSDIDKAKKLIKQIGLELAQDPDLGPKIMEPLKMQGVEDFGEYAIKIRTKMMTKPGEQFVIRRRANAMIKKAFDANGVHFAFPTVQLAGGSGDNDGTAVAAAARQVVLKPVEAPAA